MYKMFQVPLKELKIGKPSVPPKQYGLIANGTNLPLQQVHVRAKISDFVSQVCSITS